MKKILTRILAVMLIGCILCVAFAACEMSTTTTTAEPEGDKEQSGGDVSSVTGNNVFVVTYKKTAAGKVTATVYVAGTVKLAGFSGSLKYDGAVLDCASVSKSESTMYLNDSTDGEISFSCAGTGDITKTTELFKVEFTYSGSVNTLLDLSVNEASDASLNDVTFSCQDITVAVD